MLGLMASATIENEGPRTALIHVEHPQEVELLRKRIARDNSDKVEPRVDRFGVRTATRISYHLVRRSQQT